VHDLVRTLQDVAYDHLAEVRELVRDYYDDPDALEPVDAATLRTRLDSGDVVVLDVRPADEYLSAHVAGALSIPLDELDRRLSEIPRDRQVVAYCRGPYCLYSRRAVERLRSAGFQAFRMEEGVREWASRGLPVTVRD
jgi:rhodanese-related sulfurtransferase